MKASYWESTLTQRISRRKALTAAGSATAAAAFLAACGGGDEGGGDGGDTKDKSGLLFEPVDTTKQAKRGGVLKRNFNSDFPSLDPSQNYAGSSGIYETVLGRLIGWKPGHLASGQEDQIAPDVAESWEFSPDKLQITFKLRPGVKFHNVAPVNGRALDADDVVFSWDRFARTGGQRSGVANSANPNAPILSVTAVDSKTIVAKLKDPLVYALGMFGARENINLVPKEGADTAVLDLRNKMISTGPYYLSEYQRSIGFTLKRHEEFYDKTLSFVDQIDFPIIPEYAAAASQFRAGNIHSSVYGGTGGTVGFFIRQEDILPTKRDVPDLNLFLGDIVASGARAIFGWKTPALRDERVRQAFSLSHDRDLWIEVFNNASKFESEGLPIERRWYSPFPQVSTSYDGWRLEPRDEKAFGPNAKYYKHDIAEAKKLLAAAGHANGMEMPSTFPRGTEYGVNFHKEVEVRQGFNTEAGFRFQNNPIDYQTEFIPKYRDSSGNFEGISYRLGPPAPSADPVGQMHYWYHSKAGVSFFGFDAGGKGDSSGDPQVDTALTKAQQEFDLEKRKALIVDIVRYLGGKMYSIQGMGGSNVFGLAWPAVQNVNVWRGGAANNARIQNTYWWLDDTKPPLKKA